MSDEDNNLPSDTRGASPTRASKRSRLAALRRKSSTNQQPTPSSSLTNNQPAYAISLDNQPMSTDIPSSISSTSDMSALPLLESNIVSTATSDVSPVASAQTSVLAPVSSIPMVLTTNSDDLVSQPVSSAHQKRYALPGEKIPRLTKAYSGISLHGAYFFVFCFSGECLKSGILMLSRVHLTNLLLSNNAE
jgi:hypothetical protein